MAWTIAVILSLVGLSSILLFISKSFDKSKHAMKVFLTLLTFASLILIAQAMKLIIESKASPSIISNLELLSTTTLVITIISFSFFLLYFFVIYFRGIIGGIKEAKSEKITNEWGDF